MATQYLQNGHRQPKCLHNGPIKRDRLVDAVTQMPAPREDVRTKRALSGKKLRALREAVPMSRETLAAAMGSPSINNLKRIESLDHALVLADTLRDMAAAFEMDPDDFLLAVAPIPPYAQHLANTGQLKIVGRSPAAVIEAAGRLDRAGLIELVKSLPRDVLEEVLGAKPEAKLPHGMKVAKGVLLHHQLDALAAVPDVDSFDALVREVKKQLRDKAKK